MIWASLLLALITVPLGSNAPQGTLDPSWGFALHAWVSGSHGEVPVTYFTYGPLGFLTVPVLWGTWTYALALLFVLAVQVALCWVLLTRIRRIAPLWVALLVTFAVAALVDSFVAEAFTVTMALLAAELLQRGASRPRAFFAGGTVIAGLALLVKFSTGVVCLLLLAVVVAALAGPSLRHRITWTVAALSGAGLTAWTAFGLLTGHPGSFWAWLHASREIAKGYPAMGVERFAGAHYALGIGLALLLVGAAGLLALRSRRLPQVAVAAVVLLATYLAFRQGFTRDDVEHQGTFVSALMLLPFALLLGRRTRWVLVPLVALPIAYGVWESENTSISRYNVVATSGDVLGHLRDLTNPDPVRRKAHADLQRGYALPADVQAALQGHRVQVDPYQTAVVWAHDLRWGPSAVWALYTSYTPWLDDANAVSITRTSGPERILRDTQRPAIDGRFAAHESPAYQLTQLCRWHVVLTSGRWQVLAPGPSRCESAVARGSARVVAGRAVAVPAAAPGSIMTVRLRLDLDTRTRLASLLFKPSTERHLMLDGRRYRLVVANAGQPLNVTGVRTLTVDLPGEAVFEEVPVRG